MLKKKDTGFAVFSPFKSGQTKMLVNDIVKHIGFIIPLNQVGLKKTLCKHVSGTGFIIPLNQVGLKSYLFICV